jgi:CubicO group peptidase (beta-lactamase class C family)
MDDSARCRSFAPWTVLFDRNWFFACSRSSLGHLSAAVTLFAILCAAHATPCVAQDTSSRMEQIVQYYVASNSFTGAILVARDRKILLDKAYGDANLEWNIPNTPTTKFQLASITKEFTAAAILLLAERGKLNVNDSVKKYMPDAPPAWDKITIYNLLTHTSGIPNKFDGITSWSQTMPPDKLIAAFRDKPLDFEPGTSGKYSNAGYYLLGYLIEKISGQSYGDFVEENIFKPLGMNDSGYDSKSKIIPRRASGYRFGPSGPEQSQYQDITLRFSAGGLYSTTEDLLRWEQGLFGNKLLAAESVKTMTTPVQFNYAGGLMAAKFDGHLAFELGGEMDGFTSDMIYYPDDKLTVIVLNNLSGEPEAISMKLAAVAHGEKVILPSDRKEVAVSPSVLARYVGTYYDMTPGYNLVVTLEDGHLVAQATAGNGGYKEPKQTLMAESETAFFQKQGEREYQFQQNDKGEVTSVLCDLAGHKSVAVRK